MFKPFLLASVAASIVCAETTTVVDKNSHPTRPLNFVVARKGDVSLTKARQIEDPETWLLQHRKRLLAIQRKLFSARRNLVSSRYLTTNLKARRLDYLKKPSSPNFLLSNKSLQNKSIKHPKLDSDHQIYFVSLPVVLPPSNSDPFEWKGQPHTCVKGKSGHLCCNRTLEEVIISTYEDVRNRPHFSHYNVHKITTEVQKVAERRFNSRFEVIASASDFVSKINFNGDLNCKIEVDGKVILAYATPEWRSHESIELIDASGLLSADSPVSVERTTIAADKLEKIRRQIAESTLISSTNGENVLFRGGQKPVFLVYGPIR